MVELHAFHFDPDSVYSLPGSVQHSAGRLWRHVDHQATLAVPLLDSLQDIAVWRQNRSVRRDVVDWTLNLIENEDRRPAVVVGRFLLSVAQGDFEDTQRIVFEENSVVAGSRDDSVQGRIPIVSIARFSRTHPILSLAEPSSCHLHVQQPERRPAGRNP
jgi:hypothetical protein